MGKAITRNEVISSLLWKLIQRGGAQGVGFFVSVVLARLLLPKDYGLIALILMIITLASAGLFQADLTLHWFKRNTLDDIDSYNPVSQRSPGGRLVCAAIRGSTIHIGLLRRSATNAGNSGVIHHVTHQRGNIGPRMLSFHVPCSSGSCSTTAARTRCWYSGTVGIVMAYQGYGVGQWSGSMSRANWFYS